ncbi:universal stress protein [Hymenobacter sp. UYAg731]
MQPTFVVLSDLNSATDAVLRYTSQLATQLPEGHLVLMHVFQDPLLLPESALMVPVVTPGRHAVLADLAQRADHLPVPAEPEMTIDTLGLALADAVMRHHPLLLAAGREQPANLIDRVLSNMALPVLQGAHYPLLLVPEESNATDLPRRIVVAADDQPFWLTAPSLALADLFEALQPTTTVVHVAAAHGPSKAGIGLDAVRRTGLFGPLDNNSLYEVREESPADGILHAAAEVDAQLIVVLARPHTLLGGLFHRSVTAQLLHRSPVPVLVLPTTD